MGRALCLTMPRVRLSISTSSGIFAHAFAKHCKHILWWARENEWRTSAKFGVHAKASQFKAMALRRISEGEHTRGGLAGLLQTSIIPVEA